MRNKSKALLRQATPSKGKVKSIKLPKKGVMTKSPKRLGKASQDLVEAKNEWYNRIKHFVLKTYTKEGDFPATVFFLVKEGNGTREYSMPYPLDANHDNDLLNIMIREECEINDVIAKCCAFGDNSLETNETGESFFPDKKNSVRMLCESRYEMIFFETKFKDGKITFENEERDYTHSNKKSDGGLCNLFYSSDESVPIKG